MIGLREDMSTSLEGCSLRMSCWGDAIVSDLSDGKDGEAADMETWRLYTEAGGSHPISAGQSAFHVSLWMRR